MQNVPSVFLGKWLEFECWIFSPQAVLGQHFIRVPWGFESSLGCI